jgi:hypothetical protein
VQPPASSPPACLEGSRLLNLEHDPSFDVIAAGGPDRVYMMRARGTWVWEGVGEEPELLVELDHTVVLKRAAWCGEPA